MNKGKVKGRGATPRPLVCQCFLLGLLSAEGLLLLLGRPRDVLDHSPQFSPELLLAVIDAVQVCARTIHALNDPAGLPDVLVSHLIHRKLR